MEWIDASGTPKSLTADDVTLEATRGDATATGKIQEKTATVAHLLKFLNGQKAFGGGLGGGVVSVTADGYLLIADSVNGRSNLSVSNLTIGGAAVQFESATAGDVILHPNVPEVFTGAATPIKLNDYFSLRDASDYEAFIVIPLPLPRDMAAVAGRRRAAIHISFKRITAMNALWPLLETMKSPVSPATAPAVTPDYGLRQAADDPMLPDERLREQLSTSINLIGRLIQPINDTWYWSRAR